MEGRKGRGRRPSPRPGGAARQLASFGDGEKGREKESNSVGGHKSGGLELNCLSRPPPANRRFPATAVLLLPAAAFLYPAAGNKKPASQINLDPL